MKVLGTLALRDLQAVLDARGKAYDLLQKCHADTDLPARFAAELSDVGRWFIRCAGTPELQVYAKLRTNEAHLCFKFVAAHALAESAWADAPRSALRARRETPGEANAQGTVLVIRIALHLPPQNPEQEVEREARLLHRLRKIIRRKSREELLASLRVANDSLATATDKAHKEAREAHDQLFQLQKLEAIGQLTGGLAHDFNNLLAIIVGNLDLLAETVDGNAPALKRVSAALAAAERGTGLTRSLLAVARNQNLAPELVELRSHLVELLPLVRTSVGGGISLIDTVGKTPLMVCVDLGGLDSAILNLAANARDAMKGSGVLTVECTVSQDGAPDQAGENSAGSGYACISVTDNGPGMSAEVRERAFDAFFTTKERGRGTGLGLSMVHGFCRQSGGDARIESAPGRGTSIRLFLPLVSSAEAQSSAEILARHVEPGSGRVIVVDDEPELLEVTSTLLEQMGYSVQSCHTGADALRLLGEGAYDLLVTDVIMPTMDGFELARRARQYHPGIGLLYLSGFAEPVKNSEAKIQADLLQKPYTKAALARMAQKAMTSARPDASAITIRR